jgi:predicted amidohydrolase
MTNHLKVVAAQCGAVLGDTEHNTDTVLRLLEEAADASLIVFPECILSGYMFADEQRAAAAAVERDGPELNRIAQACARLGVHVVIGFLEKAEGTLYNTAALIGPRGPVGYYRKEHLPFLGVDRFVTPGRNDGLAAFETPFGRIGLAICYDVRFPESARCLALAGCDIIAMPSVWPDTADFVADHMVRVRACENRVFVVACTRGDSEGSSGFMGKSQIVDPRGDVLALAGTGERLLRADLDLQQSREKKVVTIPGEYEVSIFADRRPDAYSRITQAV